MVQLKKKQQDSRRKNCKKINKIKKIKMITLKNVFSNRYHTDYYPPSSTYTHKPHKKALLLFILGLVLLFYFCYRTLS